MDTSPTMTEARSDDAVNSSRGRVPKWPFVLAAFLFAVGIAIAVLWPIEIDYYTHSPGPVYDSSDYVTVIGGDPSNEGELFWLTIVQKQANVFEYIGARLDPTVAVVPRENIRSSDTSPEDLRRANLASMEEAKNNARFVALTYLGYEVTYEGAGALVIDTVEGSGAHGVLLPDDVIVDIDGKPISLRNDVIEVLTSKGVGDAAVLTVERGDEVFELTIVLGPHTDDPDRPMVGVLLDDYELLPDFPVPIMIDSSNVGGPSAGLMFTLQIIDQLTPEPMTNGHRVAGTGVIFRDGTVGPIGAVPQKVFAAIDAGATAVLVPALNYDDAVEAAGDDIVVVRVATIDDALDYLATL